MVSPVFISPSMMPQSAHRRSGVERVRFFWQVLPSALVHGGLLFGALWLTHAVLLPESTQPTVDMVFEAPLPPEPAAYAMAEPPLNPTAPALTTEAPDPEPRTQPPAVTEAPPLVIHAAPTPVIVHPVVRPAPPRPPVHAVSQPRPTPASPPVAASPVAASPVAASRVASLPAISSTPPATVAPAVMSGSWRSAVLAWIQSRKRYPEEARRRSAEGQVTLRITVTAGGDIVAPEILHGSGSDMLDNAALTIVRGGHVPAFPSEMTQAKVTLNVGVSYRLDD